jgi:hypothetical protein
MGIERPDEFAALSRVVICDLFDQFVQALADDRPVVFTLDQCTPGPRETLPQGGIVKQRYDGIGKFLGRIGDQDIFAMLNVQPLGTFAS